MTAALLLAPVAFVAGFVLGRRRGDRIAAERRRHALERRRTARAIAVINRRVQEATARGSSGGLWT